jgi:hypothetical protein
MRTGVMTKVAGMYVVEDLPAFLWRDAALEDNSDVSLVELVFDDDEGLAAAHDHPRFSFIHWKDQTKYIALNSYNFCLNLSIPLSEMEDGKNNLLLEKHKQYSLKLRKECSMIIRA